MPTHGSLTKAGKVRNQTPQIASVTRKKRSPQRGNRRSYQQLLADERFNNGRNQRGRRRRRRR
jgi:small subunit ribosomal protein S30e